MARKSTETEKTRKPRTTKKKTTKVVAPAVTPVAVSQQSKIEVPPTADMRPDSIEPVEVAVVTPIKKCWWKTKKVIAGVVLILGAVFLGVFLSQITIAPLP